MKLKTIYSSKRSLYIRKDLEDKLDGIVDSLEKTQGRGSVNRLLKKCQQRIADGDTRGNLNAVSPTV